MPLGCRVCPQPQTGLATLLPGEDRVGPAFAGAVDLASSLEQAARTQAKAKGQSCFWPLVEGWEEIQGLRVRV